MQRRPIHRGGILSASYDPKRRYLDIEFDTHRILRYEAVGREVAERFLSSASPASYFRDEIRDEYGCSEISGRSLINQEEPRPKKGRPRCVASTVRRITPISRDTL